MKLSIITVCFNNKDGLVKTIDSVRNQTFKDYEFIVVDGGSKDGSKEIIEANKDLFSFWCSEPDGGIYQGMNKGIDHANGEYYLFLNSGDYLAHNDVLRLVFLTKKDADILYGDIIRVKGNRKQFVIYPKVLTFYDFYKTSAALHHQATFFRRSLFLKYGKYEENSYMNADWRFYYKTIVLNNIHAEYIGILISICDASGTSSIHSIDNPKEIADMNYKRQIIEKSLPILAILDYEKMIRRSFLLRAWQSVKWRLSILIPLKWMIWLHR